MTNLNERCPNSTRSRRSKRVRIIVGWVELFAGPKATDEAAVQLLYLTAYQWIAMCHRATIAAHARMTIGMYGSRRI